MWQFACAALELSSVLLSTEMVFFFFFATLDAGLGIEESKRAANWTVNTVVYDSLLAKLNEVCMLALSYIDLHAFFVSERSNAELRKLRLLDMLLLSIFANCVQYIFFAEGRWSVCECCLHFNKSTVKACYCRLSSILLVNRAIIVYS